MANQMSEQVPTKTGVCVVCDCPDDDHYDWCSAGPSKASLTQEWVTKVTSQPDEGCCSAGGPPHPMPIPQAEWQQRFAARIMKHADWAEQPAMQAAESGYEYMTTESPEFANDPEGAADEEMSCWTDDGDG